MSDTSLAEPMSSSVMKEEVHSPVKREMAFAFSSGLLLAIGFGLSFVSGIAPRIPIAFYAGAYIFGGYYTSRHAIADIRKGHFEIDFLMLLAAAGAAALGEWAEGALLLFLFSTGHALEHYAMGKARRSIEALAHLAPKTALLKRAGELVELPIEKLQAGDLILVKPNSRVAADGIVVTGSSSVNQAPITGESIPVDKSAYTGGEIDTATAEKIDALHRVFAGTINGSGTIEVQVTRLAADSTIARLVKMVNEAQAQKSPTQNFTDKIEKYYVPAVLILVAVLLFAFLVVDEPFSASFYRAMAVLVGASPCALAISTPSAVLSGVARAARGGVLVKGGKPLEDLGSIRAIAFDKTGTLTEGKPALTGVHIIGENERTGILEAIVAVEKLSDHPLAAAIVKVVEAELGRTVPPADSVEAVQGRGVVAIYRGSEILIGNRELFTGRGIKIPAAINGQVKELEGAGNTTMLAYGSGQFMAIVSLMDKPRKDASAAIQQLRRHGIRRMVMLTGDNQQVANAIAGEVGIEEAWGNLLPGQKLEAIEKLGASGNKIAMVGDGVNDAPAMARSTVGIAMGAAGSDVALETADVALMADKLSNLPFVIGLSRKASAIIRQNVAISLGMVAILIPLTILGYAKMGPAVIGHEGSTIVVVFNALRLLVYKGES